MKEKCHRPAPTGQKHKERTEHNMLLFIFKSFPGGGLMAATAEDARAAFDRRQANGWGR